MDGSLHKVQSVTGRGPSRQGIQGPAGALLRLIDLNFQEGITKVIPSFFVAWKQQSGKKQNE